MNATTLENGSASKSLRNGIPKIDYDMREHRVGILISWSIIFISSGISPIVLYFALRYAAHLELGTALGVATAVFGVFSLFSLCKRTYDLIRPRSDCRPVGATRWQMDFFNINFIIGFLGVTAVIVVGNVILNIRVYALGVPLLMTEVCFQILIGAILKSCNVRAPFRMSTVRKGEPIRSGVYVLAEDIIAVDAGQGQKYRRQLEARYLASETVQKLCAELDWFWGVTGTVVGVVNIVLLFVGTGENVAFILGFVIPWGFAAIMAVVTLVYCKRRLRAEVADPRWLEGQGRIESEGFGSSA